jgi:hypothetical protein
MRGLLKTSESLHIALDKNDATPAKYIITLVLNLEGDFFIFNE